MPIVHTKPVTADELLTMGDVGRCELIFGEMVMMSPAGAEHGVVALRVGRYLSEFVERHRLGGVFAAETGFILDRNPDTVRAPDASFVRKARLGDRPPRGYFDGAPDLVAEVTSPGDTRRNVNEKVNLWLARGTATVWVADPQSMTVTIHRVGRPPQRLATADSIRDEPLLPGFELKVESIFQSP